MELENIILDAFEGVSVFIGHKIRKKLVLVPVAVKKILTKATHGRKKFLGSQFWVTLHHNRGKQEAEVWGS